MSCVFCKHEPCVCPGYRGALGRAPTRNQWVAALERQLETVRAENARLRAALEKALTEMGQMTRDEDVRAMLRSASLEGAPK